MMKNPCLSFPVSIRILTTLLLALLVSTIFPTRGANAATQARWISAYCQTEMHLLVMNFTGEPNEVEGTLDSFECVSSTMPEITHASVTVHGSATGTPDHITITETDYVTWLDAEGDPVAYSTVPLTRIMTGTDPAEMTMIAFGVGDPGPVNQQVNVATGIATRCPIGNTMWVYTNQDAGGYQDYG